VAIIIDRETSRYEAALKDFIAVLREAIIKPAEVMIATLNRIRTMNLDVEMEKKTIIACVVAALEIRSMARDRTNGFAALPDKMLELERNLRRGLEARK
jgi:hypothetical protein